LIKKTPFQSDKKIEITDCRKNSTYIVNDEFIDYVAKLVGVFGGAVYNSLLRHENKRNKKSWPGIDLISEEWGISRPKVIDGLNKLEELKIIQIERSSGKHNNYFINDVSQWKIPDVATSQSGLLVDGQTSQCGLLVEDPTSQARLLVDPQKNPEPVNVVDSKVLKESLYSPPAPPKIKQVRKNKRQHIEIDYDTEIEHILSQFKPDLQISVKSFIAVVASENKTGLISQSKQWSLLCQLSGVSTTTNENIFKSALLEAIERKKPNVNYLREIIKTKSQSQIFSKQEQKRNPEGSKDEAKQTTSYVQNKNGTWTCKTPDGRETNLTNEELERLKINRKDETTAEHVHGLISGLADAKSI
jgi:hypothetical protein